MKKAFIIHPDGSHAEVEFNDGSEYETIRTAVGGWIEAAPSPPGLIFWCNEEGKINGLPINKAATHLWWGMMGGPLDDYLVGTVIITGDVDGKGASNGLTDEHLAAFTDYMGEP